MPMEPPDAAALAATSASEEVKPGARGSQVQPAQRRSPQPVQGGAARAALATANTGGDGAAMVAHVRRIEQRLEAERRHVDRQMQRLERRVEEVACASAAGGRWAELRGHVDSLAETVQGLVRGGDDGSWQHCASGTSAGAAAQSAVAVQSAAQGAAAIASQNAALEALRSRADAVADQVSDMAGRLLDFGERLVRTERALENAEEVADSSRNSTAKPIGARAQAALDADGGKVERLQNDLQELTTRFLSVERGIFAGGENSECEPVRAPLWEADGSLMPSGSEGDIIDDGLATGYSVEDLQDRVGDLYEQVALLRGELEEQGADLGSRVHDTEQSLEDLAHSHEMRNHVNNVNEQVMRLALRTQRSAQNQDACEEDVRALRGEMGTYSEELGGLWMRVEGSECGLESLTGALDRVCEEVADLRSRADAADQGYPGRSWRGHASDLEECEKEEQGDYRRKNGRHCKARGKNVDSDADEEEADANGASELAESSPLGNGERPPLRNKVQEVERGLESMAEVVWDLRKQVSGMKTRVGGPQAGLDVSEDIIGGEGG